MTTIFLYLALTIPALLLFATLISFSRTRSYTKQHLNPSFQPSVAIFLPCKGVPKNFHQNLLSFCELSYTPYSLYIAVESENDTALPIIKAIMANRPNVHLVIAGDSTTCGQKNHNLVEAVKQAGDVDILIFADSDIKLASTWIEDMIAPLQDPNISVTSGFRWLSPAEPNLGDFAQAFQNYLLYTFFSTSSWLFNTGLWGGSMALRREEYLRLNVEELWTKSSVDDMSLSALLKKTKSKMHFVYAAVTLTDDTVATVPKAFAWFTRQVMYLKAHQKLEWCGAILLAFLSLTFYVGLFGALVGYSEYSYIGATFMFLIIALSTIACTIHPIRYPLRFILFSPLTLAIAILAILQTLFTNKITWSGITYTIRFKDGVVTKVER